MSFIWNDMIHITGGFDGKGRLNTVERYNEQQQKWELMNFAFPVKIESCCYFFCSENTFLIIGGVTEGEGQ